MSEPWKANPDEDAELPAVLNPNGEMLEPAEACAMLKCEWLTLRGLLFDGTLPGLKISKEWVIPRRAFTQSLNELALAQAAERAQEVVARDEKFRAGTLSTQENKTLAPPPPEQMSPPDRPLHPRWNKWKKDVE